MFAFLAEALVPALLFLGYFVVAPALTYLCFEHKHRTEWRRLEPVERDEAEPGGPFRDQDQGPRRYLHEVVGAPWWIKALSVVSLVLGHMFLPGLLAGLFGLIVYGLGLVSIPGLVLAARIYKNAFGLLRCDPRAAAEARTLRSFAIILNLAVLAIVVPTFFVGLHPITAFTFVYACISLAHAHALGKAADLIDQTHASRRVQVRQPRAATPAFSRPAARAAASA